MCGLNFSTNRFELRRMNELISHRGIRSKVRGNLGSVRLPIQGLDPKYDGPYDSGRWRIAYVGEVYEHKYESDIIYVLDAWESEGIEPFKNFDGMWSFVLWDSLKGEYHVVTDHLAKKPLYINHLLQISSEIKALIVPDHKEADEFYYSWIARAGICPFENTPFKNIKKIPPGSHWIIKNQEIIQKNTYRTLKPYSHGSIRGLLERAVKNRLTSDVPISILCSGGLDSTIIYKLASQIKDDITVVHIENDEAEYLEYLKPIKNLEQVVIEKGWLLSSVLYYNEGPSDLGSMIPQYLISKNIDSAKTPVLLTGDGADECFLGYSRAQEYDSRYYDIFSELIYYHIPRLDKLSSAFTFELRSPFLSTKVVETALSLKYEKSKGKQVLKDAFSDIVPKEIIERKKQPLRFISPRDLKWRYDLISQSRKAVYEH